jgi:CheY-like chemotaxis protein
MHLPALAILDVMMSRVHGLKVCKQLKEYPNTSFSKITMLTALGREYTKREAYQYGADAHMTKPFSPRDLINSVDIVLREPGNEITMPPSESAGPKNDFFVFNRGDEVKVLGDAGEPEFSAVVRGRIPPGQWEEQDWGYRVALETGVVLIVRWDRIIPAARAFDRAV